MRAVLCRILVVALASCAFGSLSASPAAAHSNGCHSAHSCPSDHHTYIWYDGGGRGWSCARPGSDTYDPSRDTTTISYGGYTYYCYAAGSLPPPPAVDTDSDGVPDSSDRCPTDYAPTADGCPPPPPPKPKDVTLRTVIVRVIDGDTVVVRHTVFGEFRVRLLGIDTPETYTRRECGGRQATRALKRIARVGEQVKLRTDSTQDQRDRYGRLLAYVWGSDGELMQTQLLAKGWAKVYVFERRFKRLTSFRRAQRRAKRRERGVFRKCGGRIHRPLA